MRRAWLPALLAALLGCRPAAAPPEPPAKPAAPASGPPGPIHFHEVSAACGIDFQHTDGSNGRRYILEAMSTGLATLDYDGDGLIDIYFPNGAPLPGTKTDRPPRHALYKNLGNWKFREVTDEAGVVCAAYGLGATVGDYDNDGHPDLYLSHYGPNVLLHNNGDGTFTDVTAKAGVARGKDQVGAGCCFLDIDGDGDLDLYVGNYIDFFVEKHVPQKAGNLPSYPSPASYLPVPDNLFRNNGDGTFTDVSRQSGIGRHAGRSMGMTAADYDHDGDTDLFILNDVQENFFFVNDGRGKFEESALVIGAAVNSYGEVLANMGVDCGDFDNDGRLDFFTTNYQNQWPMLLRNLGNGMLEDVARPANAGAGSFPFVNWGCVMADLDNDGWRDLFLANGHTEDNIELRDPSTCYKCPNLVLRNLGGKFADVSAQAGDGLLPVHAARGVAFDDLDNDGDLDAVIVNSRERPTILRNMAIESGSRNHWLQLSLQGVKTNRDGVGARVKVVAGGLSLTDEVHSGRGYQSHFGSRLHFGLGTHARVDRIEIRWLGGGVQTLENLPADRRVTVVESRER